MIFRIAVAPVRGVQRVGEMLQVAPIVPTLGQQWPDGRWISANDLIRR